MVAAKFFEDQPCDNGYFATVGGVSIHEINNMELAFLALLDYRVSVTGIEYNLYAQVVEAKADYLERPRQHYLKAVCLLRHPRLLISTLRKYANYNFHRQLHQIQILLAWV
jgi:Cyclin